MVSSRRRLPKRKLSVCSFIAIIIALLLIAPLGRAETAKPAKIKIGVITQLSGPAQMYGEATRNGFELARGEIGDPAIELIYEDDRFVTTNTVAAFKKLTEIDKVDLVVSTASGPSKVVAPLAEQKHIPLIAWASDSEVSEGRNYVVRSYMSGKDEGKAIAERALKNNYARAGLVVTIDAYPLSMKKGFVAAFPEAKLVLNEEYPPESNDYKTFLTKAKSRQVDALVICLNPGQNAIFAKQARELGLTSAICGCENLNNRDEVVASNNALVGAWFVTVGVTPEFRKKYVAKFGNDSIISGGAVHYDLTYLLNDIAKKQQQANILEAMVAIGPRTGALGKFVVATSPAGDRYFDSGFSVTKITDTGFVTEN